jgi:hypothetical protein
LAASERAGLFRGTVRKYENSIGNDVKEAGPRV